MWDCHLDSTYLGQGNCGPDPESRTRLQNEQLKEFNRNVLVQRHIYDKTFILRSMSFSGHVTMRQIVEKRPSCNAEECFKKFLHTDLHADDFENLTSPSVSI